MNKRDLKLDKYGISPKRYKELCGFCEQYPEWKAKTETKVSQLELQTIAQQNTLESINKSLIEISTKVGLLLEDKIKLEK